MQCDDSLPGARATTDPRGAAVGAFDELALHWVQEDLPTDEVAFQYRLELGVLAGDASGRAAQSGRVVFGVDRFGGLLRRRDLIKDLLIALALIQPEQDVLGE